MFREQGQSKPGGKVETKTKPLCNQKKTKSSILCGLHNKNSRHEKSIGYCVYIVEEYV